MEGKRLIQVCSHKLDVKSRQYLRAMTKITRENPEFALFQWLKILHAHSWIWEWWSLEATLLGGKLLVSNHYRGNVGQLGSQLLGRWLQFRFENSCSLRSRTKFTANACSKTSKILESRLAGFLRWWIESTEYSFHCPRDLRCKVPSSTRPCGPKRTERTSQTVRFINGIPDIPWDSDSGWTLQKGSWHQTAKQ